MPGNPGLAPSGVEIRRHNSKTKTPELFLLKCFISLSAMKDSAYTVHNYRLLPNSLNFICKVNAFQDGLDLSL